MAQIELVADVVHMIPHGLRPDPAIAGHLLGAPAARNPGQDLTLAPAQARVSGFPFFPRIEGPGVGTGHRRTNGRRQLVAAIVRTDDQSWCTEAALAISQEGAGKARERSFDDDGGLMHVDRRADLP